MKLENRFTVPVPVDEAWKVLLDVERIAPCMPGATLTSVDGDAFEGKVKVKVGPINLTYGGKARFVSKDDATHVAVIDGSGKETRGTGTAKALITCRLIDKGETTDVEVDTDLNVTGKPAQFGRGVLADVSGKLVDQFAACLSDEIRTGTPTDAVTDAVVPGAVVPDPAVAMGAPGAPAMTDLSVEDGSPLDPMASGAAPATPPVVAPAAAAPAGQASTGPRAVAPRQSAEAIDLLDAAGAPVLKRLAPVVGALLLLVLVVRRLRR
jgi:carbon monoxide dehydrogenase subunit G